MWLILLSPRLRNYCKNSAVQAHSFLFPFPPPLDGYKSEIHVAKAENKSIRAHQ